VTLLRKGTGSTSELGESTTAAARKNRKSKVTVKNAADDEAIDPDNEAGEERTASANTRKWTNLRKSLKSQKSQDKLKLKTHVSMQDKDRPDVSDDDEEAQGHDDDRGEKEESDYGEEEEEEPYEEEEEDLDDDDLDDEE